MTKDSKLKKFFRNLCCALIPFPTLRRAVRFNIRHNLPILNVLNTVTHCRYDSFTYYLSIIACLKNEASYIAEWIEYYKIMGVEHFYLYNNNSTDNIHEILEPYIHEGTVTLIDYPGIGKQIEIYDHALANFQLMSKWFAVVDLDEFIIPKSSATITELLKKNEKYSQVKIHWYLFGNSGHINKPYGLVIKNFLYRDKSICSLTKMLFKSTKAYCIDIHEVLTNGATKTCQINEAQCNHYFTKSEEEYFTAKCARGNATYYQPDRHNRAMFDAHNKNEVYDDSMLQYVDRIKAALAAKNRL